MRMPHKWYLTLSCSSHEICCAVLGANLGNRGEMVLHIRTSKIVLLAVAAACAASAAFAGDLPPVPDALKKAGIVRIGIKCDYPPDGFLDNQGKNQGIEVSLARQIAADALGDAAKAELTCVTAANRIPMLVGSKIDMLVATLGITE